METFNLGNLFVFPTGDFVSVPWVKISERPTDIPVPYIFGESRLYNLSYDYYGSPHYEDLLKQANPEWLTEWDIPDGTMLRIPYPLDAVLQELAEAQNDWLSNQPLEI